MSYTTLAILGIAMMVLMTLFIFFGKLHPVVVFSVLPLIFAAICGASLEELGTWVTDGLSDQMGTAVLFVFASIFFECMTDTGVFDRLLGKLIGRANNVVTVCVLVVLCTAVVHVQGSGAATFLLIIPPFYAIFKRLNMRPVVLVTLACCTAGVLNMLPWSGNAGRAAAGLQIGVNDVFLAAVPAFLTGLVFCFGMAFVYAGIEKKRGAGAIAGAAVGSVSVMGGREEEEDSKAAAEKAALARPKLFWVNVVLIFVTIASVFLFSQLPQWLVFAAGSGIALIINYPGTKMQGKRLEAYAPACMSMAGMVMAAGIYTGVMSGSGMMDGLRESLRLLISDNVAAHINTIMGVLWGPLSTIGLGHTSTCNGILPLVYETAADYVTKAQVGATYISGFSPRVFCAPTTGALFVALGLADVELKDFMRFSLLPAHILCTVCVLVPMILGFIPF